MNGTHLAIGAAAVAALLASRRRGSGNYDPTQLRSLLRERFKGGGLEGWSGIDDDPPHSLYWYPSHLEAPQDWREMELYATPNWQGREGVSIQLSSPEGEQCEFFEFDLEVEWPTPATADGDIQAYVNAVRPVILGLNAMILAPGEDMHPFNWDIEFARFIYRSNALGLLDKISEVRDPHARRLLLQMAQASAGLEARPVLGGSVRWTLSGQPVPAPLVERLGLPSLLA